MQSGEERSRGVDQFHSMALADEVLICLRLTRASNSAACLGELPGRLERRAIDRKLSLGAKQPFTLADLFFQF
jgi:hypothetical protein